MAVVSTHCVHFFLYIICMYILHVHMVMWPCAYTHTNMDAVMCHSRQHALHASLSIYNLHVHIVTWSTCAYTHTNMDSVMCGSRQHALHASLSTHVAYERWLRALVLTGGEGWASSRKSVRFILQVCVPAYVCACVYVCVCVYIYIYIYIYVCMYVCR